MLGFVVDYVVRDSECMLRHGNGFEITVINVDCAREDIGGVEVLVPVPSGDRGARVDCVRLGGLDDGLARIHARIPARDGPIVGAKQEDCRLTWSKLETSRAVVDRARWGPRSSGSRGWYADHQRDDVAGAVIQGRK